MSHRKRSWLPDLAPLGCSWFILHFLNGIENGRGHCMHRRQIQLLKLNSRTSIIRTRSGQDRLYAAKCFPPTLSDFGLSSFPLLPGLSLKSVQSSELSWRSQEDRFSYFNIYETEDEAAWGRWGHWGRSEVTKFIKIAWRRSRTRGDPRQVQYTDTEVCVYSDSGYSDEGYSDSFFAL